MSNTQEFINHYRAVYVTMQHELSNHTGSCQNVDCKMYGDGFRKAFEMLPKPPSSRKKK